LVCAKYEGKRTDSRFISVSLPREPRQKASGNPRLEGRRPTVKESREEAANPGTKKSSGREKRDILETNGPEKIEVLWPKYKEGKSSRQKLRLRRGACHRSNRKEQGSNEKTVATLRRKKKAERRSCSKKP